MPTLRLINEIAIPPDFPRFKALAEWARMMEEAPVVISAIPRRVTGYDLGKGRDRCVRYAARRTGKRSMVIERIEEVDSRK
jgi:hypothetical protein